MTVPLSTQLVTDRLLLRPPRTSDVPELRRLLRSNSEHLRPWSPAAAEGQNPASFVEITRTVVQQRRDWSRDRAYSFLVTVRGADTTPVGRVTVSEVVRGAFQNASLGYWVDARHQAQGYTTEAVRAAVRFTFATLGLHRLQAAVLAENGASRRVLAKIGFRQEGIAQRYLQIAGRWQDHLLFGLTSEEPAAGRTGR